MPHTSMDDFWLDQEQLKPRLARVHDIMLDVVRSNAFPLADAVESLVQANGKMLRPAFLLIASDFGKKKQGIDELAAAIELLHVATLIHDDVIDQADTRRGITTLHARFGVKEAVLAGDWLLTRCFRLASEHSSPANARLIAQLLGSICSEEIHQDMETYLWPASVRNYLRKISGKTAALFGMALRVGASESKAMSAVVSTLTRVGYNVGMAFQITDDILDFRASEGDMRKPVGKDLREGLCTLPLILALASNAAALKPLLGDGPMGEANVANVLTLVRDCGALEHAKTFASAYTKRAILELDRLPDVRAKHELRHLCDKLLGRSW